MIQKTTIRKGEEACPKIGKWSILGIATASSGKRQELDPELACPTPINQIPIMNNILQILMSSERTLNPFRNAPTGIATIATMHSSTKDAMIWRILHCVGSRTRP